MAYGRLRTANYSDAARQRLGEAFAKAREAAGYKHMTKFAKAAGINSVASLEMLEKGKPGVGQTILFAVGRFMPGWTEDTPRAILEGAPPPDLTSAPIVDEPPPGVVSIALPPSDTELLMQFVVGSDRWLEVASRVYPIERLGELTKRVIELRRMAREIVDLLAERDESDESS